MKITDQTEQSRARKGPVKNKNAKAHSSSGVHASLLKRSKNGKDKQASSAVSNGTSALESRPIQSIKSTSFNDRQSQLSKVNPVVLPKCLLRNSESQIILFLSFLIFYFLFWVIKIIVWHFLIVFALCFSQHTSKSDASSSEVAAYVVLAFICQCFIVRKIHISVIIVII